MATGSAITSQRGFTYLGMMFVIIVIGISLAAAGTVWQTEVQREREKELLFVGEQYRQAIASYYESTPNGPKQYPASLEDLLQDNRFPEIRRHLRRIYPDPVTGSDEWGLVKDQGRITGVYSKSEVRPLMKVFTDESRQGFSDAATYAGWAFVYKSKGVVVSPGGPPAAAGIAAVAPVTPPAVNSGQPANLPAPAPPANNPDDPCASQIASDYANCREACAQEPFATCTACYATLRERTLACRQNRTLPPLLTK